MNGNVGRRLKTIMCFSNTFCSAIILGLSQTSEIFLYIPAMLVLDVYLISVMLYEYLQNKIEAKVLNQSYSDNSVFPLVLKSNNEISESLYFTIKPFVVIIISMLSLCAFLIIIFKASTWAPITTFGICHLIYLSQLLIFYEKKYKKECKNPKILIFIFSICITLSAQILMNLAANPLVLSYKTEGSVIMLVILSLGLVPSVNLILYRIKIVALASSIVSIIVILSMSIIFMLAIKYDDIDMINYSRCLGIGVPLVYTFTDLYAKINLEPNKKTGIFITLWTFTYIAAMAMAMRISLLGYTVVGEIANYGIVVVGIYCLVFDTICRSLDFADVEILNFLILSFFGIPSLIFVPLYSIEALSLGELFGILFIFYALGIFALSVFFISINLILPMISELFISVELNTNNNVALDNKAAKYLSIIWKAQYMVGVFILTRYIYFKNYTDNNEKLWILSQSLILLVIAMLHSIFIENFNFYIKEKFHLNPSLRRISIVKKIHSSLLQVGRKKELRLCQAGTFGIWALIEIISCLCFIKNLYMAPIVVASIFTLFLFLIIFEMKLRVWDKEEEVQQYFCIFVWSCLYLPFVCGFSVIYCIEGGFADYQNISLLVFFIVFIVCVLLGFFPSMVYARSSCFNKLHMKNYLKKLKAKNNNIIEMIIEDIEKNINLIKMEKELNIDINGHQRTICPKCNDSVAHEKIENPFKETNARFFKFLLFDPSYGPPSKVATPEPQVFVFQNANEQAIPPPSQNRIFDIKDIKRDFQSFKEKFGLRPEDRRIIRTNFSTIILSVYPDYSRNVINEFFIEINHRIAGRHEQIFNVNFIDRMLELIAKTHYETASQQNKERVRDDILGRPVIVENDNANNSQNQMDSRALNITENIETISHISDFIISFCMKIDNTLERFVPYSLLSQPDIEEVPQNNEIRADERNQIFEENQLIIENDVIQTSIEEVRNKLENLLNLNHSPNKTRIYCESSLLVLAIISTGSIVNVYSLSSLALGKNINWLDSKTNFSELIIPSDMGWLAGQVYTFTIVALFFIASIIFFVYSEKENEKEKVKKTGSVFMKLMVNAMVIENFIGILSNMTCRKNELGESFVLNNDNMKCFSGEHIALFVISTIAFLAYFLLAILFYPSLYKISNETESFFNIEVLGKAMYACVVVFISDEYMNFKLIFTVILIYSSLVLSIFGYFQGKYNYEIMISHMKENAILLWIYFWAVLSYNNLAQNSGFWILVVTTILLTVKNYYNTLIECKNYCCSNNGNSEVINLEPQTEIRPDIVTSDL